MIKDKKATAFLTHTMKVAVRKQNEINHIQKLQRKAINAKRPAMCGRHSELPTDPDWEAIAMDRKTMRFYDDKLCKGANRKFEQVIVDSRKTKRWF